MGATTTTVEVDAVDNVLAWIGGAYPSALAQDLNERASRLTVSVFGDPGSDGSSGVYSEIDELGKVRGKDLLHGLIGGVT